MLLGRGPGSDVLGVERLRQPADRFPHAIDIIDGKIPHRRGHEFRHDPAAHRWQNPEEVRRGAKARHHAHPAAENVHWVHRRGAPNAETVLATQVGPWEKDRSGADHHIVPEDLNLDIPGSIAGPRPAIKPCPFNLLDGTLNCNH